jgi:hypothetical protein
VLEDWSDDFIPSDTCSFSVYLLMSPMREENGGEHIAGLIGVLTATRPGRLEEDEEGEEINLSMSGLALLTAGAASTY